MKINIFPDVIRNLPEAGLDPEGLRVYISHSDTHEVWFLETDVEIDAAPHAHAEQWSTVLSGKAEVTMNGETQVFEKGDHYSISDGVEHTIKLSAGYSEILFLNTPNYLGR